MELNIVKLFAGPAAILACCAGKPDLAPAQAAPKPPKPFGMSKYTNCVIHKDGSRACEVKFFTKSCDENGNCQTYPFDPKTDKITGGPLHYDTTIEAAGELSIPPREELPPLSIVGKALICYNRRPDGPCWNLPEGENTYHNGDPVLPLTRLSNTKCPSPAVAGAPPCVPLARLRYCVEIKGCRILVTRATDLSPVPLPPVRYVKPVQ